MHKFFFIFGTLVALLISLSQAQNGNDGEGDPPVKPDNFKFADLGDEFAFLDGDDLQFGGGDDMNSDGGDDMNSAGGDSWRIDFDNNADGGGDQSDNGGVVVKPAVRQPGGGYQSGGNWRVNRGQQAGGGYIRPAPGNRPGGGNWRGNQPDDFQTGGGSRYQPGGYYVGRQDDGYGYRSGNYYGGSRSSNQGGYYNPKGGSRDTGSVFKDVQDAIKDGFNKLQDGIHHALKGQIF